jgi:hypothetical protein
MDQKEKAGTVDIYIYKLNTSIKEYRCEKKDQATGMSDSGPTQIDQ